MEVSREEMITMKMNLLKDMDTFVRNRIGDEDIIMTWFMCGLPDGYDEIDLKEIAEDDELWNDCIGCFRHCIGLELKKELDDLGPKIDKLGEEIDETGRRIEYMMAGV